MAFSPIPFPFSEDSWTNFLNFFQDVDFNSPPGANKKQGMSNDNNYDNTHPDSVEDILNMFLPSDTEPPPPPAINANGKRVRGESVDDVITTSDGGGGVGSGNGSSGESVDDVITTSDDSAAAVGGGGGNGSSGETVDDVITTTAVVVGDGGGRGGQHQRRLWVKDRSKAWWEECNGPEYPEEEFKKAFRMSKATFNMICEELESKVTKKDTMLRQAIPVRQRVAVCIWRLATGEPLREVSRRFGLGISTCHKLILEVSNAIQTVLMPKFIQWPDDIKINQIKYEYQMISGIPNVGGAMYTTHIPIIAPKASVAAFFNKRLTERNQKTSYSVTLQGVVDNNGVFTDVCIGWPGSMSDDQVLEKSILSHRANQGQLKNVWVIGNSGIPLTDWTLVPYTHQNLTWTQHAFNEKVGEVENVAKEAFMRLKARWRCLQKRTEVKLEDLPVVFGACCVLHNVCEMWGEDLDPALRFELFDDEVSPENPVRSVNAMQARDQIAHKLLHQFHAGTNFL